MGGQTIVRCLPTIAVVLAFGLACGPRTPPQGPIVFEDEVSPHSEPALVKEVTLPRTRTGTISRAELSSVLALGVGDFLTKLDVEAYFEGRSFWGWQIQRYDNPWVDLLPGDIITSVNGKRIETPAQVQALWQSLGEAEEIIVAAYRNENPFELRFTVQGQAASTAP